MDKFVLIYSYGSECDGGITYKTFLAESKDKALFDLELDFDRIQALRKQNAKKCQEMSARVDSIKDADKKHKAFMELNQWECNRNDSYIVMGDFKFSIEEIAYWDHDKNTYVFYANIITLDEWFTRELAT